MKLTLQIKLLPNLEQQHILRNTLKECNKVCNEISKYSFNNKIWKQYDIHHKLYHSVKVSSNLSSQIIIRCISKVADSYKLDKKVQRIFRPLGAIAYDSRVLTYQQNEVSIWTTKGRLKIPFLCHNTNYLANIKGEADLMFRKGKFYLLQTIEISEKLVENNKDFIGCDFGLVDICTLSTGKFFNGKTIKDYREKRRKIRSSIQRKGTKSAKRLLKRLSGRERTFGKITNHTISKQIVQLAKSEGKGIAIEDLTGIRLSANRKSKKFRADIGNWSFNQLRKFITYKALLNGVQLISVPPHYTSKICSNCFHIGNRQGKSFTCNNCGLVADADLNGAKNIALLGATVNLPEGEGLMYCKIPQSYFQSSVT